MRSLFDVILRVALLGCAPSPASIRTPSTDASPARRPSSPPVGAALGTADAQRTTPPPTRGSGPPGSDDPGLEQPLVEHSELDAAGGLRVVVRWQRLTGQTHVAGALTFTTAGGTLRFEPPPPGSAAPDGEQVLPDYPLIERVLPAGTNRWVVLGWSSFGEGMETVHAWLLEDRGGPQQLDALAWTTDRSHAGIALDASANRVRIGIPLPENTAPEGETPLHQPGAWMLKHGAQELDLDEVGRLPFSETHVMALRDYYDPPFQYEPSRRHWSGRFVWFSADSRFALDRQPNARLARPR